MGAARNRTHFVAADIPVTIHSTHSRDKGGIRPRGVMLEWVGAAPSGYSSEGRIFLPVFRRSTWRAYHLGITATFRGEQAIIVSRISEVMRSY